MNKQRKEKDEVELLIATGPITVGIDFPLGGYFV